MLARAAGRTNIGIGARAALIASEGCAAAMACGKGPAWLGSRHDEATVPACAAGGAAYAAVGNDGWVGRLSAQGSIAALGAARPGWKGVKTVATSSTTSAPTRSARLEPGFISPPSRPRSRGIARLSLCAAGAASCPPTPPRCWLLRYSCHKRGTRGRWCQCCGAKLPTHWHRSAAMVALICGWRSGTLPRYRHVVGHSAGGQALRWWLAGSPDEGGRGRARAGAGQTGVPPRLRVHRRVRMAAPCGGKWSL